MSIVSNVLLDWKIFPLGFGLLAFVALVNTKVAILPVGCLTFVVCTVLTWFISMCLTFVGLHKLLQKSEPLELSFRKPNTKQSELPKQKTEQKPKPKRVKKLTSDIERFFITKWYKNISRDDDFTEESLLFLEDVINRLVEVQFKINNKVLLHAILNIYLKHLKEFRRSLKRKEKYSGSIKELYRYSHICSSSSARPKDYFIHQLTTNLLRHFINSELWNSLPCQVLVSILARRLVSHILNISSNPEILNYVILNAIASKGIREKYNLDNYTRVHISLPKDDKVKEKPVEEINGSDETQPVKIDTVLSETKGDKEKCEVDIKKVDVAEEPVEGVAMETRTASDPVKIHEPKGKNLRTWTNSKDLTLGISLGQDPLDALQGGVETTKNVGRSTFWDTGDATVYTLHNIKDLQESTVNNALHKIGDFQDEAAGVVEGILDFGRAGFRKGLRLTGLQDNIENAKASLHLMPVSSKQQPKKKFVKSVKSDSPEKLETENGVESVWINPLQIDSPNFDGQILLERPKKIEENDMKPKEDIQVPFISMEPEIITDSPDPEYEDTADLATSIAKLRSLLQQRSSESSVSTPAVSPMPPEEFPQRLAEAENISDIDEGDGVMPSFYKFCAKTATGVFDKTINTIKTALPSNIQGIGQLDNAWIFVQTDQTEAEILTRMKKLLTERKEYCTLDTDIDTAYEAIDSLETYRTNASGFPPNVEFEDELDDFEVKLPITKALVDIMCELLADTNSPFLQEPLVKAILLSFGTSIQNIVISKIDGYMECLLTDLITIPETSNYNTLSLEMDAYVEALLNGLPDVVNVTFGKPALTKALTLLITSLQIWNINQDIALQIFELISMKLIEERTQISPPASA